MQPLLRRLVLPIPNSASRPGNRHSDRNLESAAISVIVLPGDVYLKDAVRRGAARTLSRTEIQLCPYEKKLNILEELLNRAGKRHYPRRRGLRGAHAELLIEVASKIQAQIVNVPLRGKAIY